MELTADKILNIPITSPESLFSQDNIKDEYRKLAMRWHPDKNSNSDLANKVLAHINCLYNNGVEHLSKGQWHIPGLLELKSVTGSVFRIKYRYNCAFELGNIYVGNTTIIHTIKKEFESLYHNGINRINSFEFASDRMEQEFSKYLPSIKAQFETNDYFVLVINKTVDVLPLPVVLKYFNNKIDARHVAWILSSLHNMLCYLNYTNLVHNAIDINNYYVSPKYHSGLLLGGWWYSTKNGEKLKSVPIKTFNYMTAKSKTSKLADKSVDDELSRALARTLLGDEGGSKLTLDKTIPKAMLDWVRLTGSKDRIKDYTIWKEQILIKSFKEIKFVPMIIDINEAYNKVNKEK
jgi:hypothetical protein